MRLRKVVSTKPIVVESDESDEPAVAQAGPGPRTSASRAAAAATTRQPSPPVVPSSTLKRKRDNAAGESAYAGFGTRPVVLLRRVVSTKPQTQENATKAPPTPSPPLRLVAGARNATSPARRASPAKRGQAQASGTPVPKIQMRKVVDAKKGRPPAATSPAPDITDQPQGQPQQAQSHGAAAAATSSVELASQQPPSEVFAVEDAAELTGESGHSSETTSAPQHQAQSSAHDGQDDQALVSQPYPLPPPSEQEAAIDQDKAIQPLRRTSRTRRSTGDVFGPVSTARTTQSRRKPVLLGPPDTSVFFSMSLLALKTLTNNNTLRNQKQLAELETEVVVKEGKRPDSPTTKVRTTLEKQRETRVKEREERAARRAKRLAGNEDEDAHEDVHEGGEGAATEAVDGGEIEQDSMMTEVEPAEPQGPPLRHRRGPGDESEYETPERPVRPVKRGRFEDGDDVALDKRVKWDRGLHTTVYLDDTPPRPRRPTKDEEAAAAATRKGCLRASAKVRCASCHLGLVI